MSTLNHLNQHIEQDIKGKEEFEKSLETKAKESIKKLKEKGKLSDQELTMVYATNYKKLFSGEIKSLDILTKKISDLDQLTNKLIAKYLNEKMNKQEKPYRLKKCIYLWLGIDSNITKNGQIKNVMKGVIDELLSIPEMLVELARHPVDSFLAIYNAIAKDFTATMGKIIEQYTNLFSGLWTPEDQYKTWRAAALAILTFFPGGVLKGAWKLWTLAKNTLKSVVRSGVKETAKKVVSASKEVAKKAVNNIKEVGKKTVNAWKESAKNLWKKADNAINQVKNTSKNMVEKVKNRQLKTDIKTLNKELNKMNSSPKPDLKKIKELEKQITQKQRELSRSNTKLGFDNNKIRARQKGLESAQNHVNKAKQLKAELKVEMAKATPDPKLVSKLEKGIARHTDHAKALRSKWKNFDTKIIRATADATRAKIAPSLVKKGFSLKGLTELLKSPLRLKVVKGIRSYLKAKKMQKRLHQQIASIDAKLNKVWKSSWKTAQETVLEAKKLGLKQINLKQYQDVLKNIKHKEIIQKAIKKTEAIQKIVKQNMIQSLKTSLTNLIKFWLITKVSGQALNELEKDATLAELAMYLQEDNDQFNDENETNSGLESWKTEISNDMLDSSQLNSFTDEELKTVKITLTGKASKTWSEELNTRIATTRANNMKKILLEKYPTLNPNNIEIKIALQPQDSEDDLSDWQGCDMDIKSENHTYVAGYDKISQKDSSNQ